MSNFAEGIVKEINNIRFSNKIVENVDCVDEVITQEKAIGDIVITLIIGIDNYYNRLKNIDSIHNITFLDWFGFDKEFKQLFTQFREYTDLSKEMISNNLCKYDTCENITADFVEFKFTISPSFLSGNL